MLLPLLQVTVDSNGDPVDVDFYRSFWGLQSTFQAPYDAMVPAAWSSAVKTIQTALKRFKQEGVAAAGGGHASLRVRALCSLRQLTAGGRKPPSCYCAAPPHLPGRTQTS